MPSREDADAAVDFYQNFLHIHQQRKEVKINDKKKSNMYKFATRCKKYRWKFFENTEDNRKMLHDSHGVNSDSFAPKIDMNVGNFKHS